jgi:hypothetical protein
MSAMVNAEENEPGEPAVVAAFLTAGEAEVAQAKLRAFGIESAIDDQIEGGTLFMEDEPGVFVQVRDQDAAEARRLLAEDGSDGMEAG